MEDKVGERKLGRDSGSGSAGEERRTRARRIDWVVAYRHSFLTLTTGNRRRRHWHINASGREIETEIASKHQQQQQQQPSSFVPAIHSDHPRALLGANRNLFRRIILICYTAATDNLIGII